MREKGGMKREGLSCLGTVNSFIGGFARRKGKAEKEKGK